MAVIQKSNVIKCQRRKNSWLNETGFLSDSKHQMMFLQLLLPATCDTTTAIVRRCHVLFSLFSLLNTLPYSLSFSLSL